MTYKSTLTNMVSFNVTGFWEVEVNDKTFDAEKFTFVFCEGDHSSFDIKSSKRVSPEELQSKFPEWNVKYTIWDLKEKAYEESRHKVASEKFDRFKKDLKELLTKYNYEINVDLDYDEPDAEVVVTDNDFFKDFPLCYASGNTTKIEL